MPRNTQPEIDFDHHKPRKIDKKKRHAKGFSDEVVEQRQHRINFKKYLEQVEEELAADDDDELGELE